jgi:hypothetical protein
MDCHNAERRPWLFQPSRSRPRSINQLSTVGRRMNPIADIANDPGVPINGRPIRWDSTLDRQGSRATVRVDRAPFAATSRRQLLARHLVLGGLLLATGACVLLTATLWNA